VKCDTCNQTVSAQQLLAIAEAKADVIEGQIVLLRHRVELERERTERLQDEWLAWRATARQDYTPERANLERAQYATLCSMVACSA
jgi:hypothetical protein